MRLCGRGKEEKKMKQKALLKVTYEALHDLLKLPDDCEVQEVFRLHTHRNIENECFYVKIKLDHPDVPMSEEGYELPIVSLDWIQIREGR
jgi:hypothetical protein